MKSAFGDRNTVGTIYQAAQTNSVEGLTLGDIGASLAQSLVEDLNESIASNPFDGKPFYINIVEERDLQMKNAIKRRIFVSLYRPYPEDGTTVFYVEPKDNRVYYCWDMPHYSELPNIIGNEHSYDKEYISEIKAWLKNDLHPFGFIKVSMDSAQVEGYEENTINSYREAYYIHCQSLGMDKKSLEVEKKYGFFWVPNAFFKYKEITKKEPTITILGLHG
jgi:hypothetical protein